MNTMQQLTPNGLKFIQDFEGCVLTPYSDAGGVWTIGYGFTYLLDGSPVRWNTPKMTQEEADAMFEQIVQKYVEGVLNAVTVPLNSNQLCALTDFAYNCGINAFMTSDLCKHVNTHSIVEADFTMYDHVGKVVNQGLLNRRIAEYNLFITNVPNKSINMETENTPTSAETVAEVQIETQVLKIKSISVTYDKSVNGVVTMTDEPATVTMTAELAKALALPDAGLVEAGYNIVVE